MVGRSTPNLDIWVLNIDCITFFFALLLTVYLSVSQLSFFFHCQPHSIFTNGKNFFVHVTEKPKKSNVFNVEIIRTCGETLAAVATPYAQVHSQM